MYGTWRWYFAGHPPAALVGVPVQDWWVLAAPAHWVLLSVLSSGEHGCVGGVWREPMLPGDLFPNESIGGRKKGGLGCLFYAPPRLEGPKWIMFKITVGDPT